MPDPLSLIVRRGLPFGNSTLFTTALFVGVSELGSHGWLCWVESLLAIALYTAVTSTQVFDLDQGNWVLSISLTIGFYLLSCLWLLRMIHLCW